MKFENQVSFAVRLKNKEIIFELNCEEGQFTNCIMPLKWVGGLQDLIVTNLSGRYLVISLQKHNLNYYYRTGFCKARAHTVTAVMWC